MNTKEMNVPLNHERLRTHFGGKDKEQGSLFNPRNVAIGLAAMAGLELAFIGYRFVFGKGQNSNNSNEERVASKTKTSPVSPPANDWKTMREKEKTAALAKHEPIFLKILKDGDTAWDNNKKSEAVQHYSQLLSDFCGHGQGDRTEVAYLHKPEMARVAGRTIDFLADSGNDETAKTLIKKTNESGLLIIYSSPKSNRLVEAAKAEVKQEYDELMKRLSRSND